MRGSRARKLRAEAPVDLKLDLGCGNRKEHGFWGIDIHKFDQVDEVQDLRKPWPWADGSVTEIRATHFIEHLTAAERCHFFNECFRVLKQFGRATITTPYWASNRAYGDPTHVWPPVSEMTYYYLDADWRESQAPHTDVKYGGLYSCNFKGVSWGYQLHQSLSNRCQEYQAFAAANYKDAALDMIATLPKT